MGGRRAPGEMGRVVDPGCPGDVGRNPATPCPSREAVVKSVGVRWSREDEELTLELKEARGGAGLADAAPVARIGAEGIRFGRGGIVALPIRFEEDRLSTRDGGRLRLGLVLLESSGSLIAWRTVFPDAMQGIASTSDLAGSKSTMKASITSSIGGGGDGKLNS